MYITGMPHTCSSHMLAGFDEFNGTGSVVGEGDEVPGYNGTWKFGEVDMVYSLLRFCNWYDFEIIQDCKNIIAITTKEQICGANFLRMMGFKEMGDGAGYDRYYPVTYWHILGRDFRDTFRNFIFKYATTERKAESTFKDGKNIDWLAMETDFLRNMLSNKSWGGYYNKVKHALKVNEKNLKEREKTNAA